MSGLGIDLFATSGLLCNHEGHFQPGNRYSANQTTRLAIQGAVMICHSLRLPNQTSGIVQLGHPPRDATVCHMGMLEDFGGWAEVASCPQSAVHLQTVAVLSSLIQGLMNTGW